MLLVTLYTKLWTVLNVLPSCWKLDNWIVHLMIQKKHFCLLKLHSQIRHFWHCCISLMIKSKWLIYPFFNRLCALCHIMLTVVWDRDWHDTSKRHFLQKDCLHVAALIWCMWLWILYFVKCVINQSLYILKSWQKVNTVMLFHHVPGMQYIYHCSYQWWFQSLCH